MSGYLARLATRLSAEPELRPRLASRFEPAPARRALEADLEFGGGDEARGAVSPGRASGMTVAPFLAPAGGRAAIGSGVSSAGAAAGASGPVAVPDGSGWVAPTTSTGAPPPAPAHSPAQASMPGGRARPLPAVPDESRVPVPGPVVAVVRRAGRPSEAPVFEARPVQPRVAARGGSAARVERAEPDIVQVHIGRVEVRAVLPAAPAPAARRPDAPRPLSLERYLAGERRP